MNDIAIEADWLAAAVAPWTISPHPNFSESEVLPQGRLALVTERREREEEKYDAPSESLIGWRQDLISSARASLVAPTQRQATTDLWGLAFRGDLPVGARVVAALYASLGSTELEESTVAVDRIGLLFSELVDSRRPDETTSSFRLAMAILLQQGVARSLDAMDPTTADSLARQVLEWVPRVDARAYEEFRVSRGISWDSTRVQKDMAVAARAHASAALANLESFASDRWVQVVRGRSGWIDMRMAIRAARRDSAILRDQFEAEFESTSGKRVFMRTSVAELAYDALLVSELSGDTARIRTNREEAAKILLLSNPLDEHSAREALRLLRHARANDTLKAALRRNRAEGPNAALEYDARLILARASRSTRVSEQDLAVLDFAADFLTESELQMAITAALSTLNGETSSDWSSVDKAWKAIGRLVVDSKMDAEVAAQGSILLANPSILSSPVSRTLSYVVAQIDWSLVPAEIREPWLSFAESHRTDEDPSTADLSTMVLKLVGGFKGSEVAGTGLELAAYFADNGASIEDAESGALGDAAEAVISFLSTEVTNAQKGILSFGGLNTANVAAAFAIRFEHPEVWRALTMHLINDKVDSGLKAKALNRLSQNVSALPQWVIVELQQHWAHVNNADRVDRFFEQEPLGVFPEAVRLGSALNFLSAAGTVDDVLKLVTESDRGKVEAARTIPFIKTGQDGSWAHTLLLMLSRDKNPDVRCQAGESLVGMTTSRSLLTQSVTERVGELLASDGVILPMRLLFAIKNSSYDRRLELIELKPVVAKVAGQASARVIRDTALSLLDTWDDLDIEAKVP